MIGKLIGKVDSIEDGKLILDVNGVGYLIFASANTLGKLQINNPVTILIETYVREDIINLYGFLTSEEKYAFNNLTTVSGVGPKVAIAILSHLSFDQLALAIAQKEKEAFKAVSGVGPKLAERIILELKTKIGNANLSTSTSHQYHSSTVNDALSALTNLGISRNDAYTNIKKIIDENPNISLNDLIRQALQTRR